MPSLRASLLAGAALGAAAAALWLSISERAMPLRARLPQVEEAARTALMGQPGCEITPELSDEELLALVRADLDDPGCPGDQRVVRLLAERDSEALRAQLHRALVGLRSPERARLRVALAMLRRERELVEPIREALALGRFGPRSQDVLVSALSDIVGPEVLETALSEGGVPRYDAGHSLAAYRLAGGDLSARAAVIEALEHELARPTLPTSDRDPGLSARQARLAQAAMAGLGLDLQLLRQLDARLKRRLPLQGLPDPLSMALANELPDCEEITKPACARRLIELLELPPEPFTGWVASEQNDPPTPTAPLPAPWDAHVEDLSATPELLAEAAAWIQQLPERRAGRLLGAVANRDHAYGPTPLASGQRGDPADAVRYGGATPGAVGVAARALAAASDVELELSWWGDSLVISAGQLRAFIGPCGPGTGMADPSAFLPEQPSPVDDAALVDLAWMEQAAGQLALGELEAALEADAHVADPMSWPSYRGVRASLLATQGVRWPGLSESEAAMAAEWALAAGHADTAAAILAAEPRLEPEPPQGAEALGAAPPHEACARAWTPSPAAAPASP